MATTKKPVARFARWVLVLGQASLMVGAGGALGQTIRVDITPEMAAKATFSRGRGCNHCNHTGYRGRIGIFEMMKLNSQIREMTFAQAPSQAIRKIARQTGMRSLLEDGIIKSLKGSTTLDEVLSTCHAEIHELQSTSME